MPQVEIPIALRQLQLISQHATQQANGFFASRLARLWQDIHWGSLLFLSPLWPLALTHPQLLEDWELRVIHKGESARNVEKQLFGVRLLEICQALVDLWRLPIWVQQGYRLLLTEQRELVKVLRIARDSDHPLRQQNRLDDDPTLRRWLNQPANTVLLANGLALSAQQAWDSPHSERWQYLTSLYLQMPMAEVQQQLHQQAANSARHACHARPLAPRRMRCSGHGARTVFTPGCYRHRHRPPKTWRSGATNAPSCWSNRAASPTPCT